jgi:hypothetical protein
MQRLKYARESVGVDNEKEKRAIARTVYIYLKT